MPPSPLLMMKMLVKIITKYQLKLKALSSCGTGLREDRCSKQHIYSYGLVCSMKEKGMKKGMHKVGDRYPRRTIMWLGSVPATCSLQLHVFMEGHRLLMPLFPHHKMGSIHLDCSYVRESMRGIAK